MKNKFSLLYEEIDDKILGKVKIAWALGNSYEAYIWNNTAYNKASWKREARIKRYIKSKK